MVATANAAAEVSREANKMDDQEKPKQVLTGAPQPQRLHLAEALPYLTMHIRSRHGQYPVTGTEFFFTFRIKNGHHV